MAEILMLAVTAGLIPIATVGAVRQLRPVEHALKIHGEPIQWPLTWAEELAHAEHDHRPLATVTPIELAARRAVAKSRRHSGRCGHCGRFAAYVPGMAPAVDCTAHGVSVGALTGPIVLPHVELANPYTGSISIQLGAAA